MCDTEALCLNGILTVNEDCLSITADYNHLTATVQVQLACSVRQVQCNKEATGESNPVH